jgi:hydrocephalus-inducing protein
MELSYTIRFKPDARIDYFYDLTVVTEREKFVVPIKAQGFTALLDVPDAIDFGSECPVRYESEKTVLMRNVGDKPTRFYFKCPAPYTVSVSEGYLDVNSTMQVQVYFKPDRINQPYNRDLMLVYGSSDKEDCKNIEAAIKLTGAARNADVQFSSRNLNMQDTYIALISQATFEIINNSDVPVDFSWR